MMLMLMMMIMLWSLSIMRYTIYSCMARINWIYWLVTTLYHGYLFWIISSFVISITVSLPVYLYASLSLIISLYIYIYLHLSPGLSLWICHSLNYIIVIQILVYFTSIQLTPLQLTLVIHPLIHPLPHLLPHLLLYPLWYQLLHPLYSI